MKKASKWISVLLTAAMVGTLLAGCGSGGSGSGSSGGSTGSRCNYRRGSDAR